MSLPDFLTARFVIVPTLIIVMPTFLSSYVLLSDELKCEVRLMTLRFHWKLQAGQQNYRLMTQIKLKRN